MLRKTTVERMNSPLLRGTDGKRRCFWGASSLEYVHYHDTEWGRPITTDQGVFERMCLEGFQSGLSWITILRKRENFRTAFCGFEPSKIAQFNDTDVQRLLGDAGIVRHRGKIEATINNARAFFELHDSGSSLAELFWSAAPADAARRSPKAITDIAAKTPESIALSKHLIRIGFRFVGPTTMYAAMQAMGIVNDHLAGCHVRSACAQERRVAVIR